jgi:hypothetical protein
MGLFDDIRKAVINPVGTAKEDVKKLTKAAQRAGGRAARAHLGPKTGEDLANFLTRQAQGGVSSLDSILETLGTAFGLGSSGGTITHVPTPGGDAADDPESAEAKARAAGRAQRLRLFKAKGRKTLIRTSGQGVRERTTATTRARAT